MGKSGVTGELRDDVATPHNIELFGTATGSCDVKVRSVFEPDCCHPQRVAGIAISAKTRIMQVVEERIVPILQRIHRSELLDAVAVSLDAIPARCAEVGVLTADGEVLIQVVEAVACPVVLISAKVPKRVCDFVGSIFETIACQGSLRFGLLCLLDEVAQTVIGVALSIRLT